MAGTTPFSIATGVSAAPFLTELMDLAREKCGKIEGTVYPIRNDFFGETITVAGLVTGGDLIAQLRGKPLGERLLIPQNMLRPRGAGLSGRRVPGRRGGDAGGAGHARGPGRVRAAGRHVRPGGPSHGAGTAAGGDGILTNITQEQDNAECRNAEGRMVEKKRFLRIVASGKDHKESYVPPKADTIILHSCILHSALCSDA